ncbi:lysine-specific demethylase 3A-like isoform X2 [Clytia hemisphaerica]|uniref:lysine-specific demethylase 3A-like isoform X2 n=1 Tax=Clytia hemisphaerica TaxID=252671 RepID=UPI0034D6A132
MTEKDTKQKMIFDIFQIANFRIFCSKYGLFCPKNTNFRLLIEHTDGSSKKFQTWKPNNCVGKQFFIEYLIVEVLVEGQRCLALTFMPFDEDSDTSDHIYLQYFGTKKVEKISKSLLIPYKNFVTNKDSRSKSSNYRYYQLEDCAQWFQSLKMELILFKSLYAVSPCSVKVFNNKSGNQLEGTISKHNIINRTIDVIVRDSKNVTVDLHLDQIEFNYTSNSGLNDMLNGNAPSHKRTHHSVTFENLIAWKPPVWINLKENYLELFKKLKSKTKSDSQFLKARSPPPPRKRSRSIASSLSIENPQSVPTKLSLPSPDFLSNLSEFSPNTQIKKFIELSDLSHSLGPSPYASPVDHSLFTFPTHNSREASAKSTPTEESPSEPVTVSSTKKQKKKRYFFPKEEISDQDSATESIDLKQKRKSKQDSDGPASKKAKAFEAYLQKKTCLAYRNLPRCLDCNQDYREDEEKHQKKNDENELTCRFSMFRTLRKMESGKVKSAGFCTTDVAEESDLFHWKFQDNTLLDLATCKSILSEIGAQFEQLVLQEQQAQTWTKTLPKLAWKRAVLRVRELCDLCATSIFNNHWTCEACGLSICLDCFFAKFKKKGKNLPWAECESTGMDHKIEELRVTQIIPDGILETLYEDLLKTCEEIKLDFKRLDLLEYPEATDMSILESNINWRKNPLDSIVDQMNVNIESAIPSTPANCAWFCDGRMLHINQPRLTSQAMDLFKSEWAKGKPVIVSNVHKNMNRDLWTPESFERDFGGELNDIVNCFDGTIMEKMPIREFWRGFEKIKERPECKQPVALLKLKDWPPGTDFKEKLPNRFHDIMQALPASPYTHRNGEFNLSARLPDFFAVPDLGPKMYNAYGSASYPKAGTTNLHLDISDATNVIAYVGIPDDDEEHHQKEIDDTYKTVDKACCDATKQRIRDPTVRPGALWHIFPAHSAYKIRRFLRKVAKERGMEQQAMSDPIHDQSFYLDQMLLERLRKEEDVEGYAICQCLGDAVFIPAGAPHQVLNLHSCIKVAEDFVAPEHISHCFQLTQEFRYLSDYHTNHEDKLQIKNIIYHAVKDCLGVVKKKHAEDTS